MKASKLIELLQQLPSDTEVFAWYDGDRQGIADIDFWDKENLHADINLEDA